MSVNHYDAENDELTRIAGSTRPVDVMVGATASAAGSSGKVPTPLAGDQDKVLQGNGAWGKKLQVDIVTEGGQTGYINSSNEFVPFKSQADVSAAAAAARVGNATAADVLAGKTFTNASGSGLTGELDICSAFIDQIWSATLISGSGGAANANPEFPKTISIDVIQDAKYILFGALIKRVNTDLYYFKSAGNLTVAIQDTSILKRTTFTHTGFIDIMYFIGLKNESTSITISEALPPAAITNTYLGYDFIKL